MKHKNTARGGAKNERDELLAEAAEYGPGDEKEEDLWMEERIQSQLNELQNRKEALEKQIAEIYSVNLEEKDVDDYLVSGGVEECTVVNQWIWVVACIKVVNKSVVILDDVIKCPECGRIVGVLNDVIQHHDSNPPCRMLCAMSKKPVPK